MAFRLAFVLVSLCVLGAVYGDECDDNMQKMRQCMRDSFKRPGGSSGQGGGQGGRGGGQGGGRGEMKAKADKCFTDNGCTPPQMGPPGGRAGRTEDEGKRQCFSALRPKKQEAMNSCMKRKDPSFTPPTQSQGGHGGFGGGFGGEHHGFGGGEHGGQGGQGGFMQEACKNKPTAVPAVQACMKAAFGGQGGQGGQHDSGKEARCKCKSQFPVSATCKAKMEQRHRNMCECQNEVTQSLISGEPACKGQSLPPRNCQQQQQHKEESCP